MTQFVAFADFTIEVLDGWPTLVEQDPAWWINNTGGQIGFWSYTVREELLPGDFNSDRTVDLADLAIWQSHFGDTLSVTPFQGDTDSDGDIDGTDFLKCQQNAHRSLPDSMGSGLAAVPEPSAAFLAVAGLAGLAAARDRRSSAVVSQI